MGRVALHDPHMIEPLWKVVKIIDPFQYRKGNYGPFIIGTPRSLVLVGNMITVENILNWL